MATGMTTPVGLSISAFDAERDFQITFKFNSRGGNQVVGNILNIYSSDVSKTEPIFSKITTTYAFETTITKSEIGSILQNGYRYYFTFQTFDVNYNNQSNLSEPSNESVPIYFWCYQTPTIGVNYQKIGEYITTPECDFRMNFTTGATSSDMLRPEYYGTKIITTDEETGETIIEYVGDPTIKPTELINTINIKLYQGLNLLDDQTIYPSSLIPPYVQNYKYSSFQDDKQYILKITIQTQYGTVIEHTETLKVQYDVPPIYTSLLAGKKCRDISGAKRYISEDGYIPVFSKIGSLDPITYYPSTVKYYGNSYIDISDTKDHIVWDNIHSVDTSKEFLIRLKLYLARLNEDICVIGDKDSGNYMSVQWNRYYDDINQYPYDVFTLFGYENNELKLRIHTEKPDKNSEEQLLNNVTEVYLAIYNLDGDYYIGHTIVKKDETVMSWDETLIKNEDFIRGNVEYNKHSQLMYENTLPSIIEEEKNPSASVFSIIFEKFGLYNGIFDYININTNLQKQMPDKLWIYDEDYVTIWDYTTALNCNFKQNINGGLITVQASKIAYFIIRRHWYDSRTGIGKDVDIVQKLVNSDDDLNYSFYDYYVPNNATVEYSVLVKMETGEEISFDRQEVSTVYNKLTISDNTNAFQLYSGVSYANTIQNTTIGVYNPIGSKYPVVIQNGESNYFSGVVSGKLLGYKYEENRKINISDIKIQSEEFLEFLTNGNTKTITDWYGNIWIAKISDSPNIDYENNGTGVVRVSFSFVEQGKWDNYDDLHKNNLIKS